MTPESRAGGANDSQKPANEASGRKWLMVGLGNPGPKYANTPHNLGFMVIDRLAERHRIAVSRREGQALVGAGNIGPAAVVLAKPQTFMNLSGPAVKWLLERYSLRPADMILVYDELALPWRSLRIRSKGSAGGHRGVESVIRSLGTAEFTRVRLGIHPGHPVGDGAEFVLAPFRRAARKELDELLEYASEAVESIVSVGVETSMTRFNRRAHGSNDEGK